MSQACGCHAGAGSASRITEEETVDQVARLHPGALAVLKGMGLNHCCGGHLTLREAAAAAGVPIETLLQALGAAQGPPA